MTQIFGFVKILGVEITAVGNLRLCFLRIYNEMREIATDSRKRVENLQKECYTIRKCA